MKFGGVPGHSINLLALASNVQTDLTGATLPFFSPTPSVNATGVNVFAQRIGYAEYSLFENCYTFPPFALIYPLISFRGKRHCTKNSLCSTSLTYVKGVKGHI